MTFVTNVGSYDLEIRYSNDTKRRISGSLIGGVYSHAYGEEDVRRHIVGGVIRRLISADFSPRSCGTNFDCTISAAWPQIVVALFQEYKNLYF